MKYCLALSYLLLLIFSQPAAAADAPMVLLISVDGMKPEAVLDAQSHGLKLPNLRAFMTDGAYAQGVRGVLPTLTYPSHTTLLTGASPAKHGIFDNTTFDPLLRNQRGWYWYAEDIKVPTLWAAAAAANLKTANVYWPVSVGAKISYNLPQIWRAGTDDDLKLQRALSTDGLEQELSAELGRYPGGMEETVAEDEIRARFAIRLLEKKHPGILHRVFDGIGHRGACLGSVQREIEPNTAALGQPRWLAAQPPPKKRRRGARRYASCPIMGLPRSSTT